MAVAAKVMKVFYARWHFDCA